MELLLTIKAINQLMGYFFFNPQIMPAEKFLQAFLIHSLVTHTAALISRICFHFHFSITLHIRLLRQNRT